MEQNQQQNYQRKYITLKEAAKISGYAPDYIGQLIRKGKLFGKQVYCTIAWMTTEKAIRQYIAKTEEPRRELSWQERAGEKIWQLKNTMLFELKSIKLFRGVLYLTIISSVGFSFLLFYIFSVSLDNKLQRNAIQNIEKTFSK